MDYEQYESFSWDYDYEAERFAHKAEDLIQDHKPIVTMGETIYAVIK